MQSFMPENQASRSWRSDIDVMSWLVRATVGMALASSTGCSSAAVADALISAQFVSYEYSESLDEPCQTNCDSSLTITADGAISNSSGLRATLSARDLQTFAAWAISQEHLDALQVDRCPQMEDGWTSVSVGIRPGIWVQTGFGEGCGAAVTEVTAFAESLASRYLYGTSAAVPPASGIVHPEVVGKVDWSKLTFSSLQIPSVGTITGDGTVYRPGQISGAKLDPAKLAELQRQATSPELLAAWPGSCAPDGALSDLSLGLAPEIQMATAAGACPDGPIRALEDLLADAVAAVPPSAAVDAGLAGDSSTL